MKKQILFFSLFASTYAYSQNVGIGTSTPNASAKMDISATDRGVLIPRVALTMTTTAAPVTLPANSLLVYNTQTAGDVTPGFYYWSSTANAWIRMAEGKAGWEITGNNGITAANFLGTINGADLNIRTTNAQRMVVTAAGNVGVGDPSPAALFTVGNGDLMQVVSTGHTRTINGTAALPAFSFTGDTDNGIYSAGANIFNIATNAAERMRVDANGNVNIGNAGATTAGAIFEVSATDRGVLIPRVALTSKALAGPITTPVTSMLVYNTATAQTGTANAVTPGHYYWDGTKWVRITGDGWVVGTSAATVNAIGAAASSGFFGTTTNSHVDLVTNGTVRGRLSNLGEFFIGTTVTALPGDLMNGVGNATFPWAVNGYTSFNGGGVYGAIQAGTAAWGAVQGEYQGTAATGAGVRGLYASNSAGTSFDNLAAGVQGDVVGAPTYYVGTYKFGVYGNGGNVTRTGGVLGNEYGTRGALGYYSSTSLDYSVYGFGTAFTTGVAAGKPVENEGGVGNTPNTNQAMLKTVNTFSLEPNSHIGLGIYGGMMGGWVRGLKYGFNVKGETYSMYVDGKGYTTEPLAYLMPTATDERVAGYMATTMQPEITAKGKTQMKHGQAYVAFDDNFKKVMSANVDDIIITATPQGATQGIYISQITAEGFYIKENNNGNSAATIAWMATSPIKSADTQVDAELLSKEFDVKMNGVMFNDNNTTDTPQSMWWDGTQMRWDTPPAPFHKPEHAGNMPSRGQ